MLMVEAPPFLETDRQGHGRRHQFVHWEKNDGQRRANKRIKDIAVETLESARLDPISGGKHHADMAAAQIV
jgi:hypothetical protein